MDIHSLNHCKNAKDMLDYLNKDNTSYQISRSSGRKIVVGEETLTMNEIVKQFKVVCANNNQSADVVTKLLQHIKRIDKKSNKLVKTQDTLTRVIICIRRMSNIFFNREKAINDVKIENFKPTQREERILFECKNQGINNLINNIEKNKKMGENIKGFYSRQQNILSTNDPRQVIGELKNLKNSINELILSDLKQFDLNEYLEPLYLFNPKLAMLSLILNMDKPGFDHILSKVSFSSNDKIIVDNMKLMASTNEFKNYQWVDRNG